MRAVASSLRHRITFKQVETWSTDHSWVGSGTWGRIIQEDQLSLSFTDKLPNQYAEWLRFIGLINQLLPTSLPFDALDEEDPVELSGSNLV